MVISVVCGSDVNFIFKYLNEVISLFNWNFYKYLVFVDCKIV